LAPRELEILKQLKNAILDSKKTAEQGGQLTNSNQREYVHPASFTNSRASARSREWWIFEQHNDSNAMRN
jgi:hypothetical protein